MHGSECAAKLLDVTAQHREMCTLDFESGCLSASTSEQADVCGANPFRLNDASKHGTEGCLLLVLLIFFVL